MIHGLSNMDANYAELGSFFQKFQSSIKELFFL